MQLSTLSTSVCDKIICERKDLRKFFCDESVLCQRMPSVETLTRATTKQKVTLFNYIETTDVSYHNK